MRSEYKLKDIKTIPNILSILRILLIPVFMHRYMTASTELDYKIVAGIVLFSGVTDLVDGFIARRFNQITELGKLLDPVADKLTQLAIIICLITRYHWMKYLFVLFIIKESTMALLGLYFMNRKEMKLDGAGWFGKLSTAVFYLGSIILFFFYDLNINHVNALITIMGIFLIISLVLYVRTYYHMAKQTVN
ncbi:MAG: CDP-alcohol phosphatidyltransferase family protein [Erysipelothrix sp.]|nr:CDP-alcohol phosphatidyltransferase family protein [Erysipelothrix sp.]